MAYQYATLDADASAALLTGKLQRLEPFFYIRYGDGALECISGRGSRTCDGEEYSPELGAELLTCWNSLLASPTVCVGDWLSASFDRTCTANRYEAEYAALVGTFTPQWLHFEALLFMRESDALMDFYAAIANDPRRKLLVGPAELAPAARMLGASFFGIPMCANLFDQRAWMLDELLRHDWDVLLYGAGMAGNIPAVRCWEQYPGRTYVNLGSALDPLGRGRTRRQQLSSARVRSMFHERGFEIAGAVGA